MGALDDTGAYVHINLKQLQGDLRPSTLLPLKARADNCLDQPV